MLKSYYEILNVKDDATKAEIKSQFRKLVRMYHPDVNSSLEAERIFKDINKAAEILLDDTKRKNYDALRNVNKTIYKKTYTTKQKERKKTNSYTFEDLFKKNRKKEEEIITPKPKHGDDITINITIDYYEAMLGTFRTINVSNSAICPKCEGKIFANGQKCSYCNGLGEKTTNKKITVKIPSAIKNKTKLRITGEGKQGENGGKNGNLYI